MKSMTAVVLAFSLLLSSVARAGDPPEGSHDTPPEEEAPLDRPPSRGTGYLVAGGIFMGLGAVNLLTAPLCKTSAIAPSLQDGCLYASLAIGGTFLVIGIPLLIVGGVKRSKYKAWQAQTSMFPGLSDPLGAQQPWGPRQPSERPDWAFGFPAPAGVGFSITSGGGVLTLSGQF